MINVLRQLETWFFNLKIMPKSDFMRSVGSVLGGTSVAQVIPIAGTVVLATIFKPSSFGLYSTWLGFVMFLGVILTGRLEMVLAVETDGQPRRHAVVAIIKTIAITSLVAVFVLGICMLMKLGVLEQFSFGMLAILIPSAAMLAGTGTLQNWAAADGRYQHLSIMRIMQAGSVAIFQIAFGLLASDVLELAIGYFAGTLVGLLTGFLLSPLKYEGFTGDRKSLGEFWYGQRSFVLCSLPASAISSATAQLPVVLVAAKFGSEAAGLLAIAMRMVGAPMSIISKSVLDVFKRNAAQAYHDRGECRAEYLNSMRLLFIIAVCSTVVIGVCAKPVFTGIFGKSWAGAGVVTLLLLPRFGLGFIASPLSYIVYVVGRQHLDLVWQLALLGMTLVTLLSFATFHRTLLYYSVGYGLLYIVYLWMSYRFSCGRTKLC
jgi:O-antigen/teichoic acid export membrane protein